MLFEIPSGEGELIAPLGTYTATVYAYDNGVPIVVHIQELTIARDTYSSINVKVLEGSSGNRSLRAFDGDFDLVLDRVELEAGTQPGNPRSVPEEEVIDWPSPILLDKGGWYRGELHAYSTYGPGTEKIAQLIKRAESAKLDFLAITDPNTLAATADPAFKSDRVVLIPATEWRHPEFGSALLYAPPSLPSVTGSRGETQALSMKIQAQGGIFAVAHPTFPGQSWQWGLDYFNAVEVWFGSWRGSPRMKVEELSEEWRERNDEQELLHPIAVAASTELLSANGQSALYYDLEVTRGRRAAMIAGSGSTGRKQRLGEPMTYIWAREKSLNGLIDGLRRERTIVTAGPDAPFVEFMADIMDDDSTDVGSGGVIPINVRSRFMVGVEGGKGAKLEILFNGYPIKSRVIQAERFLYSFAETPAAVGVYRVCVLTTPKSKGFGPNEVLAMASPIYARSYFVDESKGETDDGWVNVESSWEDPATVEVFDPSKLDPSQVITLEAPK